MRRFVGLKQLYLGMAAACLLLGLGMLMAPQVFAGAVYFVFGGVCLVYGLLRIRGYFSSDLYNLAFLYGLPTGTASVLAGLVLCFFPKTSIAMLQMTAGLFFLMLGALNIQSSLEARRFGLHKWWILCLFAAGSIAFGAGFIIWPFAGARHLTQALGGALVFDGAQQMFAIAYTVKFK